MTPYLTDPDVTLHQGDSLEVLRSMPDASVHMACTSPPFFGLRDYGTGTWEGGDEGCAHSVALGDGAEKWNSSDSHERPFRTGENYTHQKVTGNLCRCGARRIDSQIGLESSPDEWAARLVDVFREVRRVLRDDGTLWVECGDSYSGAGPSGASYQSKTTKERAGKTSDGAFRLSERLGDRGLTYAEKKPIPAPGTKAKDLIGQPWLLAFALRADGWYLRSCIIWAKPNAMPESVTDRPTTGHSYVFLFSKKPRYFYDAEALREPHSSTRWGGRYHHASENEKYVNADNGVAGSAKVRPDRPEFDHYPEGGKNARTVWTIATEPNALAICRICDAYWQGGAPREHCGEPVVQHFAAFPRELVRRMILAGTSERGVCAECGAPWVREVETEFQQRQINNGKWRGEEGGDAKPPSGTNRVTTLGWHPSCSCDIANPAEDLERASKFEPIPATVLDPFSGSGTTLLVARSLGRHSVGIELNERYAAMTRARLSQLSLLSELA